MTDQQRKTRQMKTHKVRRFRRQSKTERLANAKMWAKSVLEIIVKKGEPGARLRDAIMYAQWTLEELITEEKEVRAKGIQLASHFIDNDKNRLSRPKRRAK